MRIETKDISGRASNIYYESAMKTALAALALLCCDSSWVRVSADPARFKLQGWYSGVRPSSVSPVGNAFATWAGNQIQLHEFPEAARAVHDPKEPVPISREPRVIAGHAANVHDGGWSRDGRLLATTGFDGFVRVWDVAAGQPLVSVAAHSGYA